MLLLLVLTLELSLDVGMVMCSVLRLSPVSWPLPLSSSSLLPPSVVAAASTGRTAAIELEDCT